jgi:hypothetical protein
MKVKALIFIAMLFLFSCGVKQVTKPEPERIFKDAEIQSEKGDILPLEDIVKLEERVKTYWDARMRGDLTKMYELEDPDVKLEAKLNLTSYIQNSTTAIIDKSYEVKGLRILNPEKVRVYIILDTFINLPQVMREENVVIWDIWKKKQGEWYRQLVLNPFDTLPMTEKQKIKVKPYEGPVGDMPEKGTIIDIKPSEIAPGKNPPAQKEVPGEDSNKEQ